MRKLIALALVSLTGCANFCDTFFRERNVCREQSAASAAPLVMTSPVMSSCACSGGHVIATSEPYATQVYSPSLDCACSGTVVMSPTCVGEQQVVVGSAIPYTGAVQPVSQSQGHPLLHPFQWIRNHTQSQQQ
jgi:hypothetical protein